mmetsp:Transcript_8836/g.27861  ORF Transcript_8836/g.27861 Transcript_8836/m.27861 type:complete len:211 (+) Transcript_8836:475-1107(+)
MPTISSTSSNAACRVALTARWINVPLKHRPRRLRKQRARRSWTGAKMGSQCTRMARWARRPRRRRRTRMRTRRASGRRHGVVTRTPSLMARLPWQWMCDSTTCSTPMASLSMLQAWPSSRRMAHPAATRSPTGCTIWMCLSTSWTSPWLCTAPSPSCLATARGARWACFGSTRRRRLWTSSATARTLRPIGSPSLASWTCSCSLARRRWT